MDFEQDLFAAQVEGPLADMVRPKRLEDFQGQSHIVTNSFKALLSSNKWSSLIFWGPPGSGKTTLARIIANETQSACVELSAVAAGVKDLREVIAASQSSIRSGQKAHILFLDEIHRLNKSQQDVLLPYIEQGVLRLIGATTENPSFEINNAILSRSLVFHFNAHSESGLILLLERAQKKLSVVVEQGVFTEIAALSGGDARRALTLFEGLAAATPTGESLNVKTLHELSTGQNLYYDQHSELHHDLISAFIKSVRGSDPDAALYYLARMLEGGEDPLFIARRLMILASEDIGNASPMGLVVATAAFQSTHAIGMPEARIILAQATTYLACCEKSNRSYEAVEAAIETVRKTGNLSVPMHLRNAPTKAMKDWGYGKNYQYTHNDPTGWVDEEYLPKEIREKKFYKPCDRGVEKKFKEVMDYRRNLSGQPKEKSEPRHSQ